MATNVPPRYLTIPYGTPRSRLTLNHRVSVEKRPTFRYPLGLRQIVISSICTQNHKAKGIWVPYIIAYLAGSERLVGALTYIFVPMS